MTPTGQSLEPTSESAPAASPKPLPAGDTGGARLHLAFLDGLRGLAALYVLLFHIYISVIDLKGLLPSYVRYASNWMGYGHFGVAVFIVLSGYCLMLPVARSRDGQLSGGFVGFIKRRSRRILPPYYAALILSAGALLLAGRLGIKFQYAGKMSGTEFAQSFLAHVFVVHNLFRGFSSHFDAPMWSVATEWEIYFLFALVLLPLWRRFGNGWLLVAAFAMGLAPHYVLPASYNLDWACFWYIGLFAFGMVGAVINFSSAAPLARWRDTQAWRWIMIAMFAVIFVGVTLVGRPRNLRPDAPSVLPLWAVDTWVGLATIAAIIYCVQCLQQNRRSALVQLLSSPWAVKLGVFSYSLYLVHEPLVNLCVKAVKSSHFTPLTGLIFMFVVALPLILGIAYLFHLLFEKRFMSKPTPRSADALSAETARKAPQSVTVG